MMEELIAAVARAASLSSEQSAQAVAAVLRFFTARLPSSLVGELHARLQTRGAGAAATPGRTGPAGGSTLGGTTAGGAGKLGSGS